MPVEQQQQHFHHKQTKEPKELGLRCRGIGLLKHAR